MLDVDPTGTLAIMSGILQSIREDANASPRCSADALRLELNKWRQPVGADDKVKAQRQQAQQQRSASPEHSASPVHDEPGWLNLRGWPWACCQARDDHGAGQASILAFTADRSLSLVMLWTKSTSSLNGGIRQNER